MNFFYQITKLLKSTQFELYVGYTLKKHEYLFKIPQLALGTTVAPCP